ncbi:MAG: helix-turn-helix transcriptional regulator [Pirellulales bacterium]
MSTVSETSDEQVLDLLRKSGSLSVAELMSLTSVTATAVRQRLSRLLLQGMVERQTERANGGRGRPSHRYTLTEKARRQAGSNYADLAMVLWDEIRGIKDIDIRRGMLSRLALAMAAMYRDQVSGQTLAARMESLANLFAQRGIPLAQSGASDLPILTVVDCPYPDLAARDRGICAVEKMLFAELLNHDIHLSQCRLDGHACCEFSTT